MKHHHVDNGSPLRSHTIPFSRKPHLLGKVLCLAAAFAFISSSCSLIQKEPEEPDDPTPPYVIPESKLTLTGNSEKIVLSKTSTGSEGSVLWEDGDEIAVFSGDKKGKFTADLTEPSASATFEGEIGGYDSWPDELDIWAVYPYSPDIVFDGQSVTTTLSPEQTAKEDSFGNGMNLAISHSTSETLQFHNVGGGIRFSVTEEGINKVIFEGQNGEKIAGKIKIGLDGNGIPKVVELTDASQFITILPPIGQDTFRKGAWYYIVAVPGSLDKGYKMRFYKDEEYARRVSQEASSIQRSTYEEVGDADKALQYDDITTHVPSTEEEWTESITLSEGMANTLSGLVKEYKEDKISLEKLFQQAGMVDGIIKVETLEDSPTIMVMQRDSIWINCPLFDDRTRDASSTATTALSAGLSPVTAFLNTRSEAEGNAFPGISENSYSFSKGKKALILSPFHREFNTPIDEWKKTLEKRFEQVDMYSDEKAGVSRFREDFLSQYDFIVIDSHGGQGHLAVNQMHLPHFLTYHITTGTRYTLGSTVTQLLLDRDPKELTVTLHDGELYMCMTPHFLKEKKFDNTIVILSACRSAFQMFNFTEDDDNGSLAGAFINNGARFVTGTTTDMYSGIQREFDQMMIKYMVNGLSFQVAFAYITNSEKTEKLVDDYRKKYPDTIYEGWDMLNNYRYIYNPKTGNEPFFFFDPLPRNLGYEPAEVGVLLTWDCPLSSFSVKWESPIDKPVSYDYTVSYDVYVDGSRLGKTLGTDDTDKKARYSGTAGEHSWYVVAKVMEGDNVLATYQSDESVFTITQQVIPVESVSLDKTLLELTVGTKSTLIATVIPENASNRKVIWSSDKESVATVSAQGEVTALSKGEAVITVKTEDGSKSATCKVKVKDPTGGGDHEGTEEDPWN